MCSLSPRRSIAFMILALIAAASALDDLAGGLARALRAQAQEGDQGRAQELVFKTAETIEFSTDEVTCPSVSVSPDGRTIVFDVPFSATGFHELSD